MVGRTIFCCKSQRFLRLNCPNGSFEVYIKRVPFCVYPKMAVVVGGVVGVVGVGIVVGKLD